MPMGAGSQFPKVTKNRLFVNLKTITPHDYSSKPTKGNCAVLFKRQKSQSPNPKKAENKNRPFKAPKREVKITLFFREASPFLETFFL